MIKPAISSAIATMSSVLRARRLRFLLATSSHAGKNPPLLTPSVFRASLPKRRTEQNQPTAPPGPPSRAHQSGARHCTSPILPPARGGLGAKGERTCDGAGRRNGGRQI